jgi:hypothetical protein
MLDPVTGSDCRQSAVARTMLCEIRVGTKQESDGSIDYDQIDYETILNDFDNPE